MFSFSANNNDALPGFGLLSALGCGIPGMLGRWQATRLRFEARLAEMALDAEWMAARDAALVAAYPHLAELRTATAARRSLAKSDDGALSQTEIEHLRFILWLLEQRRIGEGDRAADVTNETTGDTASEGETQETPTTPENAPNEHSGEGE
jgi:hypothetical protein